ncbi:DUF624 domain-containing protein [Bacillus sp. BGMRC 2118]|nr:DUF624 domain-containing protein [Bacillus sp. BGMRC 2118]
MDRIGTSLYRACEWIMKFAYLNILWVVFSLVGLLVLGLFPSTTAMLAVCRKWIMKQPDIPIFKTFWETYKKDWIISNIIGAVLIVSSYFIYIEASIVIESSSTVLQYSKYPLFY